MHKQKVYSSKFYTIFTLICILLFSIFEVYCVLTMIKKLINQQEILLEIITIFFFCLGIILNIFVANRCGYIVIYDNEKNMIYRKGLICGYKYQVSIDDIQEIVVLTCAKEGSFYVLIDSNGGRREAGFKNSFIRIEKNDNNYAFLLQFWKKNIEEI